jgi:ribulose-5-phosphate 4-epimerase/fuculose-1-phosphate aldolase
VPNDEGTLIFGEAVPVSRHAPPGTWDLAQAVVEALGEKGKAALIARHGTVAVGRTLVEALLLAEKLEEVATVFFFSKTEAR